MGEEKVTTKLLCSIRNSSVFPEHRQSVFGVLRASGKNDLHCAFQISHLSLEEVFTFIEAGLNLVRIHSSWFPVCSGKWRGQWSYGSRTVSWPRKEGCERQRAGV